MLCAFPPGTFLVFPGVQQHTMGNYKELGGREAIAQLQEIVKKQSICMMVTATEEQPPHSRPMAVAEVDDRGVFWFLTLRTSEKFDDIAIIPTFVLTPLTYLGGVFYSVDQLPQWAQTLTLANPIVYMVSAFRYGLLSSEGISLVSSYAVMLIAAVVLGLFALRLLERGTGMRS